MRGKPIGLGEINWTGNFVKEIFHQVSPLEGKLGLTIRRNLKHKDIIFGQAL